VIAVADARPDWRLRPARPDQAWSLPGQGPFTLGAIHFWWHDIDFDYVDVGANVGLTAIAQAIFFGRCGHQNHVFAFEPGPVFNLLQRSVQISAVEDRVTCLRVAVGASTGRATFYVTPDKSPSSSLSREAVTRPGIENKNAIEVDVIAFDDFAPRLRAAPGLLVKIDAEGCDMEVLEGMRMSLRERLTIFQIELFPAIMTGRDLAADLTSLDERYILVDAPTRSEITSSHVGDFLSEVSQRGPIAATDVLAIDRRIPKLDSLVSRVMAG
jgi:FkbM family methyltransferase